MRWFLVAIVVITTTISDLLQSHEMKRQGAKGRFHFSWLLFWAVVCMAGSFFSLLQLLEIEDMSFAVPATAASLVLETVLAQFLLRERVHFRRWTGALLVAAGVMLLGHS